jgi:pyroglutamyl-peptidase
MRMLITSFGPFPGYSENPSTIVLELLQSMFSWSNIHEIEWSILDVSFNSVDVFERYLKNEHFDVIIHLGVASNDLQVRFEVVARNERSGKDIDEMVIEKDKIDLNGSDLQTSFDLEILEKICKKHDRQTRISKDAGTYLCNYVYYLSLKNNTSNTQALFVHVADFQNQNKAVKAPEQVEILMDLINHIIESSDKEQLLA